MDELSGHAEDPQARFLMDFLSTATPAMMHNGNQLFSQMSLYPPAAEKYRSLMEMPSFSTLMPLAPATISSSSSDQMNFDIIKRFNEDSDYVITVSTQRQEISVWDVYT